MKRQKLIESYEQMLVILKARLNLNPYDHKLRELFKQHLHEYQELINNG